MKRLFVAALLMSMLCACSGGGGIVPAAQGARQADSSQEATFANSIVQYADSHTVPLAKSGCTLYWPGKPYFSYPSYTAEVTQSYIFWFADHQVYAQVWCNNAIPDETKYHTGIPSDPGYPTATPSYKMGDPRFLGGIDALWEILTFAHDVVGNPDTARTPLPYAIGLHVMTVFDPNPPK